MARHRNSFLDGLEVVRRGYPDLSATGVLVLLYVAENPGINVAALAHLCRASVATTSRAARALLSDGDSAVLPPGLALLEDRKPWSATRARSFYLTEAGHALCEMLDRKIERRSLIGSRARRPIRVESTFPAP